MRKRLASDLSEIHVFRMFNEKKKEMFFFDRPGSFLSSTAAALLIYSTLIAGWSYLVFFGIWQLLDKHRCLSALTFIRPYAIAFCMGLAAIVFLVTYFLGKDTNKVYKKASDDRFKLLKKNTIGQ